MERPPIEKFTQEAQDIHNTINTNEYTWRIDLVSYLKQSIGRITHMASYIKELEADRDWYRNAYETR